MEEMNMKIKIVVGILSLLGMQYVFAADPEGERLKATNLHIPSLQEICAANLIGQYKRKFHDSPQVIKWETDCIAPALQKFIVTQILRPHQYEFAPPRIKHRLEGHDAAVTGLVYTLDGSRLVSWSGKAAIIWDVESGRQLHKIGAQQGYIDLKPYDITLVLTKKCGLPIYDDGRYDGGRLTAAISLDHLYMVSPSQSNDHSVIIWKFFANPNHRTFGQQCGRRKKLWSVAGHSDLVTTADFNHDGSLLASGSNDKTVIIWAANVEETVDSLNISQALLYICSRLAQRQDLSLADLTETSSEDDEEDKESESFYTSLTNRIGALTLSLFGVDQAGKDFVALCEEKQRAEQEYYLTQLRGSLPDKIKQLLDKKQNQ